MFPENGIDPRQNYWDNSYIDYWKKRVNEAGKKESNVIKNDSTTVDSSFYEEILDSLNLEQGKILDVGCAWGRMFDIFIQRNLKVTGIDISTDMIKNAKKNWSNNRNIEDIIHCVAEELPFNANTFEIIFCVATFDATYQHKALSEFIRVAKPGGFIIFSGKNSSYLEEDIPALEAEEGARKKGHPNFFTDTNNMINQLESLDHTIHKGYFFKMRSHFARKKYTNKKPAKFYMYNYIINKSKSKNNNENIILKPFSNNFSNTWKSINQK